MLAIFFSQEELTLSSGETNKLDAGIRGVHLKHSGSIGICLEELFLFK